MADDVTLPVLEALMLWALAERHLDVVGSDDLEQLAEVRSRRLRLLAVWDEYCALAAPAPELERAAD